MSVPQTTPLFKIVYKKRSVIFKQFTRTFEHLNEIYILLKYEKFYEIIKLFSIWNDSVYCNGTCRPVSFLAKAIAFHFL